MGPKSKKEGRVSVKVPSVVEILEIIENNTHEYVESLKRFADIYSSPLLAGENQEASINMVMKMAVDILRDLGAQVEELFGHGDSYGCREVPTVLAYLEAAVGTPTILVCCLLDGSETKKAPSYVFSTSKYVRGRGVHDAASFLIWINMILAHKQANVSLPYSIKFILDGSSRRSATQLIEVLAMRIEFLRNTDLTIASTSNGLSSTTPDIVYGFRGICDFFIKITKESDSKLAQEEDNTALLDMMYVMTSLVDSEGNIAIDGLSQKVAQVTEDEKIWFTTINFNKGRMSNHFLAKDNPTLNKADHLEKIWCQPTTIFKGIEKLKDEDNPTLLGKFSIFTVPYHNPIDVRKLVFSHIMRIWKERCSENKLEMGMDFWSWPWRADGNDESYRNLAESISILHNNYPQGILSGSHLALPAIIRKLVDKNVLIFTLGSFYDFQMTGDERLLVKDYINGVKLVTRLLHYTKEKPQPAEEKKSKKKKA